MSAKKTMVLAAGALAGCLAGGLIVAAHGADRRVSQVGEVAREAVPLDPGSLLGICPSGKSIGGVIDAIGPRDEEAARAEGWASSPRDAALRTLRSPLVGGTRREALDLKSGDGVPVLADTASRATQFLVIDVIGRPRGFITVADMGFGAYGASNVELCR